MSEPKLLDQVRQTARLKHFSLRTERAVEDGAAAPHAFAVRSGVPVVGGMISYDNGHVIKIASGPAPLGLVSGLESMINPRGTAYGMMKYWQTGKSAGEMMRTSLHIRDPWLRNMDSVAASHGLQSIGDVTAFIRTRYGQ